jgi:acetolactate synthase-1/2/3 large subunit
VTASDALAEVVSNAFRAAEQGRPRDVADQPTHGAILPAASERRKWARRRTKPSRRSQMIRR